MSSVKSSPAPPNSSAAIDKNSQQLDVTVDAQQALLERLIDSYQAFSELQTITDSMGSFVVCSRIKASRSLAYTEGEDCISNKKRRVECDLEEGPPPPATDLSFLNHQGDEEDNGEEEESEAALRIHRNKSSAKRMLILYQDLRRAQTMFGEEMEKFMDETESSCRAVQDEQRMSACSE